MLTTHSDIQENFRFLVLEVSSQVDNTRAYLHSFDECLREKIIQRDDYIDNLKTLMENMCFSRIHAGKASDKQEIDAIRARHTISVNLERIGDFCVNIVRQTDHLHNRACISEFPGDPLLDEISRCFPLIIPVLERADLTEALTICQAEATLDELYKKNFDLIMARLLKGKESEDLITMLFIFRYMERMGDSLLNIGEALLSAIIGERIKITQFDAMQKTLARSGLGQPVENLHFEAYLGTRSGCNISRIDAPQSQSTIFKGGTSAKIRREKENIEKWQAIIPGLTPRIITFHEEGDKAALLVEFFPGRTMEEIILAGHDEMVEQAMTCLATTLTRIWELSRTPEPCPAEAMQQALNRLDSIQTMHPDLFRKKIMVNGKTIDSSRELINQAALLERRLSSPVSVFVHGDFNANNILYHPDEDRIHFIDVYRSRQADFLQDMSVLMVSFFRLPVFALPVRKRLNDAVTRLLHLAGKQAEEWEDQTFALRLTLYLARSFLTSARFELNRDFAEEMLLRAHYLLEKALAAEDDRGFVLPEEALYY